MRNQDIKSTGCCDPFNPEHWEGKEIVWKDNELKLTGDPPIVFDFLYSN